jgi:hypothetical protein
VVTALALVCTTEPAWGRTLASAPEARDPPRVLLVVERADDPFAKRISAELTSLGLAVLTLEPWRTGVSVSTLEGAARAEGAIAAIRTVSSRKGVEIWMADQVTGRPLLRQLVVDESPTGPNQSLIALQTVELLRTSLLSRPAAPAPGGDPLVVATPSLPPAGTAVAETGVSAGVGGLMAAGGSGTAVQIWLSLHRTLGRRARRLEIDVDLSAPARSSTLSAPEGSTSVSAFLAGAALLARLELPSAGLVLDGGLGGGAILLALEGHTTPPLAASTDLVASPTGYARADIELEAARWLRVGLRGVAGVARGATIHFAGYDVGSWGQFYGAGLAIVDVVWR